MCALLKKKTEKKETLTYNDFSDDFPCLLREDERTIAVCGSLETVVVVTACHHFLMISRRHSVAHRIALLS